jgi:very-short-patch-repair endonuclease
MARQTTRRMVRIARRLRRKTTLPEVLLWQALKPADVNIRKQHPCGPFVVDFYCPAAKLVIEIEGIVHAMGDRPERDEERFAWLERHGYAVVRIPAADLLKDVGETAEAIVAMCRDRGA